MPFYKIALTSPKPKPYGYPTELNITGDHIKRRRLKLRLLQNDVATQLGISTDTLINWEKSDFYPQLHSWPKLIAFLGYDPRPKPKSIREHIRYHRTAQGLTVAELAQQLKLDSSTIARWERRNDTQFDHFSIPVICKLLGYNPLPAPKTVGEYIKQVRMVGGWHQQYLCKRLDILQGKLSGWETGKKLPPSEQLKAIVAIAEELDSRYQVPFKDSFIRDCEKDLEAKHRHRKFNPRSQVSKTLRTIGDHLRKRRLERKMSQASLAQTLGVGTCTISAWESSYREPDVRYMKRIIEFIGYKPELPFATLGEELRMRRRNCGLSHHELAKRISSTESRISLWENDLCMLSAENIEKLQEVLGSFKSNGKG